MPNVSYLSGLYWVLGTVAAFVVVATVISVQVEVENRKNLRKAQRLYRRSTDFRYFEPTEDQVNAVIEVYERATH